MGNEPPSDCPRCAELTAALRDAAVMLSIAASDGNNLNLDVMRWARRHHAVVDGIADVE